MESNSISDVLQIFARSSYQQQIDSDERLKETDLDSIDKRNRKYNDYIEAYVSVFVRKNTQQMVMKWIFFSSTLMLMMAIIVCTCICIVCASLKKNDIYDLVTLISALVSAITSFIVLPKIMANNLFPKTEEDKSNDVFKSMFKYDLDLRRFYKVNYKNKNNLKK